MYVYLAVIGILLVCWNGLFFIWEFNKGVDEFNCTLADFRLRPKAKWAFARFWQSIGRFPGLCFASACCFKTLALDLMLTFFMFSILSSAAGMIGTFMALLSSSIASTYLWWRGRRYHKTPALRRASVEAMSAAEAARPDTFRQHVVVHTYTDSMAA